MKGLHVYIYIFILYIIHTTIQFIYRNEATWPCTSGVRVVFQVESALALDHIVVMHCCHGLVPCEEANVPAMRKYHH